jgi:uncharacterized protein (TIGR02453 family)
MAVTKTTSTPNSKLRKMSLKATPALSHRFSDGTFRLLAAASRARRPDWLVKNRADYEEYLLSPLQALAAHAASELKGLAPGYRFPLKGIGRLKRPAHRVLEGASLFKNWVSYQATTPTESRFDHNPNLFFLINPDDAKDSVLVAGGLYMPSSRQVRSIREAIAKDASPFDELFADKDFARAFPDGFSDERSATRPPRGFDPAHPRLDWLKLQAFFVWKPYSRKEFKSANFAEQVVRDWRQILRLNKLLEMAISGRLAHAAPSPSSKPSKLLERLTDLGATPRKMDF